MVLIGFPIETDVRFIGTTKHIFHAVDLAHGSSDHSLQDASTKGFLIVNPKGNMLQ